MLGTIDYLSILFCLVLLSASVFLLRRSFRLWLFFCGFCILAAGFLLPVGGAWLDGFVYARLGQPVQAVEEDLSLVVPGFMFRQRRILPLGLETPAEPELRQRLRRELAGLLQGVRVRLELAPEAWLSPGPWPARLELPEGDLGEMLARRGWAAGGEGGDAPSAAGPPPSAPAAPSGAPALLQAVFWLLWGCAGAWLARRLEEGNRGALVGLALVTGGFLWGLGGSGFELAWLAPPGALGLYFFLRFRRRGQA